jgi:N-methylhydantoinase A
MRLDAAAARRVIEETIAKPMRLSVEAAAAGIYRIACNNMAQGVREVTIKRGFDPREFAFVAAGGAGPIHSCLICNELEIPLQIVPQSSSVLCAFGMLLSELQHDFVRTFVGRLETLDWVRLGDIFDGMHREGERMLEEERVAPAQRRYSIRFDCRYVKQYHEVSFEVAREAVDRHDAAMIAAAFHAEHNRLYGYSLEAEKTPVEVINVRLQAIGATDKPRHALDRNAGADPHRALKRRRAAYIPERETFDTVRVYDGHLLRCSNLIEGPAVIETATTAVFVSSSFDCVVDAYRSLVLYRKGREDLVKNCFAREDAGVPA